MPTGAPGYKGETPTAPALEQISEQLAADPTTGVEVHPARHRREPDFCDDSAPICPRDAVVAAVQAAYGRGIGTFIFSLGHDVDQSHLQDVANAGTGQPVQDHQAAVLLQCLILRATYSSMSGNAPYFEPNVDPQTLLGALTKVIAGVRELSACVHRFPVRRDRGDLSRGAPGASAARCSPHLGVDAVHLILAASEQPRSHRPLTR